MASEQLQAITEFLRTSPMTVGDDLIERRASMEAAVGGIPVGDGISVTPVVADGVPCEWVAAPGVATDRAVLYLHGGAYTAGSLNTHRRHAGNLSAACGAQILNVDYRLAPEHPHPAAVDDAVTAFRWLTGPVGLAPERIVVSGDSAGGGLAAATLVALRDAGGPMPAGAGLISPWTDLTLTATTLDSRADLDPMCSRESLTPSAAAYLAGADAKTPTASPRWADLSGLPPLTVHVGDHEVLLDDSIGFAERAREAGVDVDLWVAPEMIHVWHAFAGAFPEADEAIARLGAYLRARLDAA